MSASKSGGSQYGTRGHRVSASFLQAAEDSEVGRDESEDRRPWREDDDDADAYHEEKPKKGQVILESDDDIDGTLLCFCALPPCA